MSSPPIYFGVVYAYYKYTKAIKRCTSWRDIIN